MRHDCVARDDGHWRVHASSSYPVIIRLLLVLSGGWDEFRLLLCWLLRPEPQSRLVCYLRVCGLSFDLVS